MARTAKLTLIGATTFVVCLIALAPASLLRVALAQAQPLALIAPTGTLWRGSGQLAFAQLPLGRVQWSFAPTLLLQGRLGYAIELAGEQLSLTGQASVSPSATYAQLNGTFDSAALRELLQRYDILLSGTFNLQQAEIEHAHGSRLPQVRGELNWSGGPVSYRLSGRDFSATLPALVGFIDSSSGQPEMSVYQRASQTPLLLARAAQDGVVTVGITKQFTKLLGQPWPGSEPDHAVVLEVGEKLF
jgi:hypothetical protein